MSTHYIKISKPAYVAVTDFMGRIAAKHGEGWAKDVHTVMRRRGAADGTVKVEVSEQEAASVGKAASKLANTDKAAAKLFRHLGNKGLVAPGLRTQTDAELRKKAKWMSRRAFVDMVMQGARLRGENVDDAHDWADQFWVDVNKARARRRARKAGKAKKEPAATTEREAYLRKRLAQLDREIAEADREIARLDEDHPDYYEMMEALDPMAEEDEREKVLAELVAEYEP